MKKIIFLFILLFSLSGCSSLNLLDTITHGDKSANETATQSNSHRYDNVYKQLNKAKQKCDDEKNSEAGQNCVFVGHFYERSWDDSNTKDYATAMRYYQKGISLGYFRSYQAVGYLYENGLGVKKDYSQALAYYQKGAEAGDENAMLNLSNFYQYGKGVEQNKDKAVEYAKKACSLNNDGYSCLRYKELLKE